jgi:alkyl sulfatase BDS1-like metallo-beta-lactamase superfamily hydrolase
MTLKFLSDEWFAAYDAGCQGVQVAAALANSISNLRIRRAGAEIETSYVGGFMRKGFHEKATATISVDDKIVFEAIVLGNFKAAFPALFKGKIKIEGNKATLIALAGIAPTESQKTLYAKLKEITEV